MARTLDLPAMRGIPLGVDLPSPGTMIRVAHQADKTALESSSRMTRASS
jgi:hypothetical protein